MSKKKLVTIDIAPFISIFMLLRGFNSRQDSGILSQISKYQSFFFKKEKHIKIIWRVFLNKKFNIY